MPISIRIKRGVGGAPTTLLRGELAFDEDNQKLYIGKGDSGSDDANGLPIATSVVELTTPPFVLADLADMNLSSLSDGDVLVYDSATAEWVAEAVSIAWDDVSGKPASFTPSTHASSHHTGGGDAIAPADIGAAAATHSHAWSDITSGVPSTFTPSAHKASHATGGTDALSPADIGAAASSHTHSASDITSGLATVATTGAYSDLTGKPDLGSAAYLDTTDFVESQAASPFGLSLLDDADAAAARTTLGLGSAATSATGDFAAASHGHAWADITSGVPSTFAPSAHSHTIKQELSGFIESPEAKTYVLSPSTNAAMTITQLRAQTSAGTVDVKIQDDGADVTGATLADAGTTLASLASDISVSVAAGSKLTLVVSDPQSSPADLAFTVHYTIVSANNA